MILREELDVGRGFPNCVARTERNDYGMATRKYSYMASIAKGRKKEGGSGEKRKRK
jgi:hypothetical protein